MASGRDVNRVFGCQGEERVDAECPQRKLDQKV